MIKIKEHVPKYYYKRDFRLFYCLLEFMINAIKKDIDYKSSVLTPETCPDEYLPLLGSRVSYKYKSLNTRSDDDINRFIIKHYYELRKNRGTLAGMQEAIKIVQSYLSNNGEVGSIVIAEDLSKNGSYLIRVENPVASMYIREVLEIVRPIGATFFVQEVIDQESPASVEE